MSSSPPTPAQPKIRIDRQTVEVTYGKERLNETVELELIQIPGGEFIMGSPALEEDRDDDEGPQHRVQIQGFWMGQYPVTQAEWRIVAGFPKVERELDPDPSRFKGDRHPVEQVSWYDAVEFCQRLSQSTGRDYRWLCCKNVAFARS